MKLNVILAGICGFVLVGLAFLSPLLIYTYGLIVVIPIFLCIIGGSALVIWATIENYENEWESRYKG